MKLFIGINGDASSRMLIFATSEEQARKLAEIKIEKDGLEDDFPCLDFEIPEPVAGVIEIISYKDFF